MTLPPAYRETVFVVEDPPSPLPAAFAIITAWNPMDRPTPLETNLAADETLRRLLRARRIPHFRVTGGSPDLHHREPGWACGMPRQDAIDLARRFDQRALWWIEDGTLVLVACIDGTAEAVGSFSNRIREARPDPWPRKP